MKLEDALKIVKLEVLKLKNEAKKIEQETLYL